MGALACLGKGQPPGTVIAAAVVVAFLAAIVLHALFRG
ncbi:hypothetical protein ACVIRO_002123 [Rhizobium ruizarguesonis]